MCRAGPERYDPVERIQAPRRLPPNCEPPPSEGWGRLVCPIARRQPCLLIFIHPGEILGDELEEIGLSAKKLADVIEVPPNRLYQLLVGKCNVTADTALRLSRYFGMSADFWMNLQSAYELDLARRQNGKAIQRIPRRGERAELSPGV